MNKQHLLIGAVVLLLVVATPKAKGNSEDASTLSYLGHSNLPRGIRNNNPGNLKITNNAWQGKIDHGQNTDGVFEQFESYVFGIRAMIRLVRDSYITNGFNTITKVLNRYAPPGTSENNNTAGYIAHVVDLSGISADQVLNKDFQTMSRLLPAMAFHENGQEAITLDLFQAAWQIS